MAATKKAIEAFDYCKEYVKSMPLEEVLLPILDDVCSELWMSAPWRWTIGTFANTTIVADQSDYTIGSLPADFLRIEKAYITDGQRKHDLEVEPFLASVGVIPGTPSKIAFIPGTPNNFRIFPKMQTIATGTTWVLVVYYKKTAPRITKKTAHDTAGILVMDDEWFHVYREGALYRAYKYADDDRAGGATFQNGNASFSGQLGVYKSMIQTMRESEPLLNVRAQTDNQKAQG